ncbi:ribonuclease domain-containing protein [Pseudoxanthomonas sp. UC19_8]|uniref:ribonuclease domain-containing protein n=1 Tax=Pseudoxanthomonas sp. UC19_8 TaxID=3350175 RepID=UPI0036D32DBA
MSGRGPRPQGFWQGRGRLLLVAVAIAAVAWQATRAPRPATESTPAPIATTASGAAAQADALPVFLPPEARDTLALIARGGPFPYPQDGTVFGNYEGRLPNQPRGWYHEYTVRTPGAPNRGARRIITGGTPPRAYWYTADHYESFRSFQVPRP